MAADHSSKRIFPRATGASKDLDIGVLMWRPKTITSPHHVVCMTDPESEAQGEFPITPEMFRRVVRGKGTPKEEQAIRNALRDPNSELLDWLEGVEAWAHRAFRRTSRHSEHGDQILLEAVSRKYRDDVLAFIRSKYSQGILSDSDTDKLFAAGALQDAPNSIPSEAFQKSGNDMLDLLVAMRPEIEPEARTLRASLHPRPRDGRER